MSLRRSFLLLAGSMLLLISGLAVFSCKEKEVPYVIDEDEIARYITESNQGRQFFGTDSLFIPDSVQITGPGDTTYVLILDSIARTISVSTTPYTKYFNFSFTAGRAVRDAEALVTDHLYLEFQIRTTSNTVTSKVGTDLNRRGWFVKLGDDSRDYVGWLLYGFNGSFMNTGNGITSQMCYLEADNGYFSYDGSGGAAIYFTYSSGQGSGVTQYTYQMLSDTTELLKIPAGTALTLRSNGVNVAGSRFMLASIAGTGSSTVSLPRSGSIYQYATAASASASSAWYGVFTVEVQRGGGIRTCVIPYRIWP